MSSPQMQWDGCMRWSVGPGAVNSPTPEFLCLGLSVLYEFIVCPICDSTRYYAVRAYTCDGNVLLEVIYWGGGLTLHCLPRRDLSQLGVSLEENGGLSVMGLWASVPK